MPCTASFFPHLAPTPRYSPRSPRSFCMSSVLCCLLELARLCLSCPILPPPDPSLDLSLARQSPLSSGSLWGRPSYMPPLLLPSRFVHWRSPALLRSFPRSRSRAPCPVILPFASFSFLASGECAGRFPGFSPPRASSLSCFPAPHCSLTPFLVVCPSPFFCLDAPPCILFRSGAVFMPWLSGRSLPLDCALSRLIHLIATFHLPADEFSGLYFDSPALFFVFGSRRLLSP